MSQICSQWFRKTKFLITFCCLKLCTNKITLSIKEMSGVTALHSLGLSVRRANFSMFSVFCVNLYEAIVQFFGYFHIKYHFPTFLLTNNENILPRHKYQLLFQGSNIGCWHQLVELKSSCQHLLAMGPQAHYLTSLHFSFHIHEM